MKQGFAIIAGLLLLVSAPAFASSEVQADQSADRPNIIKLLTGEAQNSPHEYFHYYNGLNLQAVRVGNWKLHLPRTREQIPWWGRKKQGPIQKPRLYNLETDLAEQQDVADRHPERVLKLVKLAEETRLRLGEFGERGSEQRPTGTLFPEVPILSNQAQDWDPLSDAAKGRGKTEFKRAHGANN